MNDSMEENFDHTVDTTSQVQIVQNLEDQLFVHPKDRRYELVKDEFSRAHGFQCPMSPHQIWMMLWVTYIMVVYCLSLVKY